LATFLLITDILGLSLITTGIESVLRYTPNIFAAILVLFAANILGKLISEFISTISVKIGFSHGNTFGRIAQTLVLLTAIIIVVDQIGIEVTFLITMISITMAALFFGAALAFGLGARTSISNILATFHVRKIYKEGDYIKIGEIEGTIQKIESAFIILDAETGQFAVPGNEFSETKSLLIKKK
jgi:small-conductance mechanosensitive channel